MPLSHKEDSGEFLHQNPQENMLASSAFKISLRWAPLYCEYSGTEFLGHDQRLIFLDVSFCFSFLSKAMIGSRSMNSHMLTTVFSKIFQGCPKFLFKMSQGCPKDPQSCLQVISQLCQGCPNDSQSCLQVISQLCQGYPKDSQSCLQVISQLSQGCPKVSSKVF